MFPLYFVFGFLLIGLFLTLQYTDEGFCKKKWLSKYFVKCITIFDVHHIRVLLAWGHVTLEATFRLDLACGPKLRFENVFIGAPSLGTFVAV